MIENLVEFKTRFSIVSALMIDLTLVNFLVILDLKSYQVFLGNNSVFLSQFQLQLLNFILQTFNFEQQCVNFVGILATLGDLLAHSGRGLFLFGFWRRLYEFLLRRLLTRSKLLFCLCIHSKKWRKKLKMNFLIWKKLDFEKLLTTFGHNDRAWMYE